MMKSFLSAAALALGAASILACSDTGTVSGPSPRFDQTGPLAGQAALLISYDELGVECQILQPGGSTIYTRDYHETISAAGNATITCRGQHTMNLKKAMVVEMDGPPNPEGTYCYVVDRVGVALGVTGSGQNVYSPSGNATAKCSFKKP